MTQWQLSNDSVTTQQWLSDNSETLKTQLTTKQWFKTESVTTQQWLSDNSETLKTQSTTNQWFKKESATTQWWFISDSVKTQQCLIDNSAMTQSQLNFNLVMNQLQFDTSFNFWVGGCLQTTLTSLWLFLTTYPPALTFSNLWTLTKSQHFWTTYPPLLVNVVFERPLVQLFPSYWAHLLKFKLAKIIPCPIQHSPFQKPV